jgi:predicted permease
MSLKRFFSRAKWDEERARELAAYLETETTENIARGMSPNAARDTARRKLGNMTQIREEIYHMNSLGFLETLWQDVRYAFRTLRKSPAFTWFSIAVLALGIAAATTVFSLANVIMLMPLPYRDAGRLAVIYEDVTSLGFPQNTPAPGNYAAWKAQNKSFEDMAAIRSLSFSLIGEGNPQQLGGIGATANLFSVLGVEPILGRPFTADEDKPGGPRVVLLSDELWRLRFGADIGTVGRQINLNGANYTVIGVMPPRFPFPTTDTDLWVPIQLRKEDLENRGSHYLNVVGRLRPGVSVNQANADLAVIARRLSIQFPDSNSIVGAFCVPIRLDASGTFRTTVLVLLGSVGFLLLLACANIANLMLARAAGRRRELALRLALGASRLRIIRQLLTESLALSLAGGAVGLLLSLWGYQLVSRFIPSTFFVPGNTGVDVRVLIFAIGVSVLTGLIFGLLPSLRLSRTDLQSALKQGGERGEVGGSSRTRRVLVVSEVALSLMLLLGASLMLESFMKLRALDPGFRTNHVLRLRTTLAKLRYPDITHRVAFYDSVLTRVTRLPGVVSAGYTSYLPLTMFGGGQGFIIDGDPPPLPDQVQEALSRSVTLDYFRTIGLKLVSGRVFDSRDSAGSQRVAVVNQAMVKRYFSGRNPLGMHIKLGDFSENVPWITIVGVVSDMLEMGLNAPPRPEMCFPYTQEDAFPPRDLAVLTTGEPMRWAETIEKEIWAVDPQQPISRVQPMDALLETSLGPWKLQAQLLCGFAALALLLASIGIYAVMSYTVAQRTQEIGLRMALGAEPSSVLRLVLGGGLKLVALGLMIGLAAAFALSRTLEHLLFSVRAQDLSTFAGSAAVLAIVAALACWIPARRATKVDPIVALRYE